MKLKQIKRNFKKMDATIRVSIKGASVILAIQVLTFILQPTVAGLNGIIYTFTLIGMFVFKETSVRVNRYRYYLKGRMKERCGRPIITMFLN